MDASRKMHKTFYTDSHNWAYHQGNDYVQNGREMNVFYVLTDRPHNAAAEEKQSEATVYSAESSRRHLFNLQFNSHNNKRTRRPRYSHRRCVFQKT